VEAGLILEPSIPRLKFFSVFVVLPWWLLGYTCEVFNEIYVRK
jgi:hypothetical protein